MRTLQHAKIQLALHELRGPRRPRTGEGRSLLLLHALGERSPEAPPAELAQWHGPIFALDFTGHGASTVPVGGGYTAELLMADADAALAELGAATVLGCGVGGYVAALLAGARPQAVRGALVCDGAGIAGGGPAPGPPEPPPTLSASHSSAPNPAPDPYALLELERDVRPPDYALSFAEHARAHSGLEYPIAVCAAERPPWLAALANAPGVAVSSVADALARYAALP